MHRHLRPLFLLVLPLSIAAVAACGTDDGTEPVAGLEADASNDLGNLGDDLGGLEEDSGPQMGPAPVVEGLQPAVGPTGG